MVRWCEINPTDVLCSIHTHLQKVRSPVCTGRVDQDEGPFFSAENVIEIIIMRGDHTISSMLTIQAVCHLKIYTSSLLCPCASLTRFCAMLKYSSSFSIPI